MSDGAALSRLEQSTVRAAGRSDARPAARMSGRPGMEAPVLLAPDLVKEEIEVADTACRGVEQEVLVAGSRRAQSNLAQVDRPWIGSSLSWRHTDEPSTARRRTPLDRYAA